MPFGFGRPRPTRKVSADKGRADSRAAEPASVTSGVSASSGTSAKGREQWGGGVRGIDHVGVTVPDIEEATRFFIEAFDAQVMYSPLPKGSPPRYGAFMEQRLGVPQRTLQHSIRFLRLPNGPGLELFEFTNTTQRDPVVPTDFGWQHVAFYVDDIHAALERVVAAGGRALTEPNPLPGVEAGPNNRFVYARTPWDSTVELISYPDPQPYEQITPLRRWRP